MSGQNQTNIEPKYIIEDLLNQNKVISREKAYQVAINLQLQEENKVFLEHASKLENEVVELKNKVKGLESLSKTFKGEENHDEEEN